MPYPIRPLHAAFALVVGGALIGVPLAQAAESGAAGDASFRVAQAAHKTPPKAQASQPAPEQGTDAEIAELKKRLNITPQQQPQFDAFAQVMRQNAQAMEPLLQDQQGGNRNAVDDLKAAAKFAEAEAEGLKRLLPPLQALYESLSDQQKKVADQVLAAGGGDQPPAPAPTKGKKR